MSNNVLEVNHLKKYYHNKEGETKAIDNVTFEVNDKQFVAIVGPSGCGKSTVLGVIAGITSKSSGDIIWKKENPTIGYMLQQDSLFPWRTVLDNCLLGLEIKKKVTENDKQKVIELLTAYGLGEFIHSYPPSLSGGMRQRVG